MTKILITEYQLQKLIEAEEVGPPGGPEEVGTPGGPEEMEDVSTKFTDKYPPAWNVFLDEVVIEVDRKTGEVVGRTTNTLDKYNKKGGEKKVRSFWVRKGIDLSGVKRKINKLAHAFHMEMGFGPLITSGYRGPRRQIATVLGNWKRHHQGKVGSAGTADANNGKDYIQDDYGSAYANALQKIFTTAKDDKEAIKNGAQYAKERYKTTGKPMSKHMIKGAADLSLPTSEEDRNKLRAFLKVAESEGLIKSKYDETKRDNAHWHINFKMDDGQISDAGKGEEINSQLKSIT
jgi:hypothetical protein